MRILYVQPAEGFGGAERQGVLAMKTLPAKGIEVVPVIGPGRPILRALEEAGIRDYVFCTEFPSQIEGPGTVIERLRLNSVLVNAWRKTCQRVTRTAIDRQVDLIFANRAFGWTVAAEVSRRLGLMAVWRAGSRATNRIQFAALGIAGRFFRPSALVCNCMAVQESIAPLLGCRSYIVPNGVDLDRFNPCRARPRFRIELGLKTAPIIGVPARPAPEKGFDLLFEVIEQIVADVPNVRVLVAGDYPWKLEYEALLAKRGLGAVVTFLGHVDDMENFYKSCDVVLLTSKQRSIEGSPNALLEAMAMKRPVVTTRVGGICEAVTHDTDGLLSDPEDADGLAHQVMALLSDPTRRNRMGAAGRLTITNKFSENEGAATLAEVLQRVARRADKKFSGETRLQPMEGEL